ncbi:hypothetical protein [Thermobifida cellulosilytica]|uniref:hypothetical protein n=1 Tax=Thermobifida cellulosilytica TaxID=144786 RepID=UPI001E4A7017|nr:hypothetical protein [Thermobifida cellulosilytica]
MPLLLLAELASPPPQPPRRRPVVHRPRHAAPPPRQARAIPPRIPNYTEFAACARRHSALWEVTHTHGVPCPYTARNRVTGSTVAADDVDLLDHILATYEHPTPYAATTASTSSPTPPPGTREEPTAAPQHRSRTRRETFWRAAVRRDSAPTARRSGGTGAGGDGRLHPHC